MKYAFKHLPEIEQRSRKTAGFLLMLDFDGTLAPLVKDPARAILPAPAKEELREYSRMYPLVIISGRSLADLKRKVGIKNAVYAGNHGMEWQAGKTVHYAPGSVRAAASLKVVKKELGPLLRRYPGVALEYKRLSMAVHYRRLSQARAVRFVRDARPLLKGLGLKWGIETLEGKKVFDLRPDIGWHKGRYAALVLAKLGGKSKRKPLPVYVGDDATDEDAFTALHGGVTVRVGRASGSRAEYYLRDCRETVLFVAWLRALGQCSGIIKSSKG